MIRNWVNIFFRSDKYFKNQLLLTASRYVALKNDTG